MIPRTAWVAAAMLAVVAWLGSDRVAREMPDLEVYWRTAVRARAAEPLYRTEDQHYQFKYLPAFAVLSAPLSSIPLRTAKQAWFIASVVMLVALVTLSVQLPASFDKPAWIIAAATTLAMAKFYGHELILGQVNVLFALVAVLALHALRRGQEAAAGGLLALAIVVKPYAVIFLPWLLARRRPASIAAAAAGLAVVLVLPVAAYGLAGTIALHVAWWRTVTESTAPNLLNADNVSIAAMYAKWIGAGSMATALAAATSVVVLCGAIAVFLRRKAVTFPEGLEGALLLTCIPLISPQGWDYVFLISTPAIAYLVNYEARLPPALRWSAVAAIAVVGLSVFDIMGRTAYAAFMSLSVISVCFLVIAGALVGLRSSMRPV